MKTQKLTAITCIVLGIACIALAIGLANYNPIPPVEVEYGELMAQTNSIATFFNEDRGFFTIAVGELLELYEDYVIVFDTCGTADRTDDEILSVSKLIK